MYHTKHLQDSSRFPERAVVIEILEASRYMSI